MILGCFNLQTIQSDLWRREAARRADLAFRLKLCNFQNRWFSRVFDFKGLVGAARSEFVTPNVSVNRRLAADRAWARM